MRKQSFKRWLIAVCICLPAIWSMVFTPNPEMHDWTHPARIHEMKTAILDGHIPVRWSKNLGFGYGAPMFSFYAPLPYYLGGIVALFMSYTNAVKMLFIISIVGSFIGIYKAVFSKKNQYASLLAATAFTYMPYHALNIYVRGALGELFGMMFFIFTWNSIKDLAKNNNQKSVIATALSYAGLLLSHNLSILMGTPFLVAYAQYQLSIPKINRKAVVIKLLLAFTIAIGLASFFLVPMITEREYISIAQLITNDGDYSKHFVFLRQLWDSPWGRGGSIEGIFDGISFGIGKLFIVLTIIAAFKASQQKQKSRKVYSFLLVIGVLITIFFTNIRSQSIWQMLPAIEYIQFPWRFLFYTSFFISLLIGTLKIKTASQRIVAIMVGISIIGGYTHLFKASQDTSGYAYDTSQSIITSEVSATLPEYLPRTLDHLVMGDKAIAPTPINTRFDDEMEILSDKTHAFTIKTSEYKQDVPIKIFQFPGWRFWVNDLEVSPIIETSIPYYRIPLEPGYDEYIIRGKLSDTPIRKVANIISLAAIGLLALTAITGKTKR